MRVVEAWEAVVKDTIHEMAMTLNNMYPSANKDCILGPVVKNNQLMCLVKTKMEEPLLLLHQGYKALFEFSNGESVHLYAASAISFLTKGDVDDIISRFRDTELINVIISSSISEIGDEAFKDCKFHKNAKVQMSQSVSKIGDNAFSNAHITVEYNGFTLPRLGKDSFSSKSIVLEVPLGFSMDYNGNTAWESYVSEVKKLVYTEK